MGDGERLTLNAGAVIAEIEPAYGGRIGQLTVDGARLLRGREESEGTWPFWGSYPLLPWSNRIPGGRFSFEGETFEVDVNWADGTALHGLAMDAPWTVESVSATDTVLTVSVAGGPYQVTGRQEFSLSADRLDQRLAVRNDGDRTLPFGLGIHPWFHAAPVRVPAASIWPSVDALPSGPPRPVQGDEDLRAGRMPPPLDHCFTDLTGTDANIGVLQLSWTGPVTQVIVYSLAEGWVCVEPVTMATDGFRLLADGVPGHGVVPLAPGEWLEVGYAFAW